VIASAVGGLPEIVEDGRTGRLVPPADHAALASAIVELATDGKRARELGRAGRSRALTQFSLEECADRTDALYRAALARRSR
jgi:glycosyltransferase involved in cell wall biosynthesis